MASRKWDAYLTLNLTSRHSPGMTCSGSNKHEKRCRWDISLEKFNRICAILDEMEATSPRDAIKFLQELAHLSLCVDFHQGQSSSLIQGWIAAIGEAARVYENGELQKTRISFLEQRLRDSMAAQEACNGQLENIDLSCLECLEEHGKTNIDLQSPAKQVDQLRKLLDESNTHNTKLKELLNQERTSYSQQIFEERSRLAKYKDEVKVDFAGQDKTISDLRSKLDEEYQRSDEQSKSLEKQEIVNSSLLAVVKDLEVELAKEREKLDYKTKEASASLADSVGLLRKVESLESRQTCIQEQSNELRNQLEDANIREATLSQDFEASKSQLAARRDDCAELLLKLEKAEINLAQAKYSREQAESKTSKLHSLEIVKVNESFKSVELELEASHTVNEEQRSELEEVENTLKKTELHLQQAKEDHVICQQNLETTNSQLLAERDNVSILRLKLETAEASLQNSLERSQRDTKEFQKLSKTQALELANVQQSRDQSRLEVQESVTVTNEQKSQLESIQNTLRQAQLHLQNIERSRNHLISEYLGVEYNLSQTQKELANSLTANRNQKKVAAAQAKVNSDEVAVLLHRIDELEAQLPKSWVGIVIQRLILFMINTWWWILSLRLD